MTIKQRVKGHLGKQLQSIVLPCSSSFSKNIAVTNLPELIVTGYTPFWKYLISVGANASTSLNVDGYEHKGGDYYVTTSWLYTSLFPCNAINGQYIKKPAHETLTGCSPWEVVLSLPSASLLENQTAENQARANFYSKAHDAITSFEGGVFFGELHEVVRLIRHPLASLRNTINDYVVGSSGVARSALRRFGRSSSRIPYGKRRRSVERALADTWLETQYAIKPLIGDIQDIYDTLYPIATGARPLWKMVRGKGSSTYPFSGPTSFQFSVPTYGRGICYDSGRTRNDSVWYYGLVDLEPINSARGLREINGLSMENFLPTVWELIPYSFLIDYFSNVGKIVQAVSFQRSNIRWSSKVIKNTCTRKRSGRWTPEVIMPSFGADWLGQIGYIQPEVVTHTKIVRTPIAPVPIPYLQLQLPGNWVKWTNIGALISNARNTSTSINNLLRI